MAGLSFAQGEQIIGLLREIRDAVTTARTAVNALSPPAMMYSGCPACGSLQVQHKIGADGSKTWHCGSCSRSGHLPADTVI